MQTGVLLVNLGTPNSPTTADVRRYLRQFLMDGRVIDIPFLPRWALVNLIIAPFRSPKSAKVYREVWTAQGSPLMVYGRAVADQLQEALGSEYVVALGMRYQQPSIASALQQLQAKAVEKIIVLPLFPQYASATTGSVHEEVMRIISRWQLIPQLHFIDAYPTHPPMIKIFADLGRKYMQTHAYDHVIFSYHGLPERQIRKGDATGKCLQGDCCATLHKTNRLCYRAQCFATSRALAAELGLDETQYTVCFQSRLGKDPWIQPYTEDVIRQLARSGKQNILAFSPSFVADCLETTIEIGEEYKEIFEEEGGKHWQLVESLNDHPQWVAVLKEMVQANSTEK